MRVLCARRTTSYQFLSVFSSKSKILLWVLALGRVEQEARGGDARPAHMQQLLAKAAPFGDEVANESQPLREELERLGREAAREIKAVLH